MNKKMIKIQDKQWYKIININNLYNSIWIHKIEKIVYIQVPTMLNLMSSRNILNNIIIKFK
jgi:hypothetical protein